MKSRKSSASSDLPQRRPGWLPPRQAGTPSMQRQHHKQRLRPRQAARGGRCVSHPKQTCPGLSSQTPHASRRRANSSSFSRTSLSLRSRGPTERPSSTRQKSPTSTMAATSSSRISTTRTETPLPSSRSSERTTTPFSKPRPIFEYTDEDGYPYLLDVFVHYGDDGPRKMIVSKLSMKNGLTSFERMGWEEGPVLANVIPSKPFHNEGVNVSWGFNLQSCVRTLSISSGEEGLPVGFEVKSVSDESRSVRLSVSGCGIYVGWDATTKPSSGRLATSLRDPSRCSDSTTTSSSSGRTNFLPKSSRTRPSRTSPSTALTSSMPPLATPWSTSTSQTASRSQIRSHPPMGLPLLLRFHRRRFVLEQQGLHLLHDVQGRQRNADSDSVEQHGHTDLGLLQRVLLQQPWLLFAPPPKPK